MISFPRPHFVFKAFFLIVFPTSFFLSNQTAIGDIAYVYCVRIFFSCGLSPFCTLISLVWCHPN
ncbi:hypothetical protein AMTRI_Chr05g60680 [Amborella trichopoda]